MNYEKALSLIDQHLGYGDSLEKHKLATAIAAGSTPAAGVSVPEGCTPADAQMLRVANHELAAENDRLRRALGPFARLVSTDKLSWAMVEYCVEGDPEKQTFQRPQMQRAFNRAADALRENVPGETVAPASAQPPVALTDEQIIELWVKQRDVKTFDEEVIQFARALLKDQS